MNPSLEDRRVKELSITFHSLAQLGLRCIGEEVHYNEDPVMTETALRQFIQQCRSIALRLTPRDYNNEIKRIDMDQDMGTDSFDGIQRRFIEGSEGVVVVDDDDESDDNMSDLMTPHRPIETPDTQTSQRPNDVPLDASYAALHDSNGEEYLHRMSIKSNSLTSVSDSCCRGWIEL